MIRSWGLVTLGSAAVPVFGDATTAAVGLPSGAGIIAVTVASTTRYRVGDRIVIDPEISASQDTLLIDTIPSATVLNCRSEGGATTHTHTTGAIIMLSIACAEAILTPAAAANVIWIGSDNTVTNTGGGSAFYPLEPVTLPAQPPSFRMTNSVSFNTVRTSDVWVAGTSTQTYGAAAIVV
jgi:hypothetical protein